MNQQNQNIAKNKFHNKNFINNYQNKSKRSNLYIQIYETDRNIKRNETANNLNIEYRNRSPLENNCKKRLQKRKNKSQVKLNCLNSNSHIINNNNFNNNLHNINSFINLNCKTSPEEESENLSIIKPKYDKINKSKKVDKEFWEYKNLKITSNNNNIKDNNIKRKNNHLYSKERALSATPNKRNPRLNPNLYDNNHNNNFQKNYNINKDSYAYKITKKNNYKYIQDYDNNQIARPITSVGNDYNRKIINKNNKSKNRNYIKKDINGNNHLVLKNKSNICNKINQQNNRKLKAKRPNSCKFKGYENNLYFERKNNSRRYDPDITEPELLMMVNPIKIKENYKNSQKSSLNINLNNNNNMAENPNNFLHHIKTMNQNLNLNTNIANGKNNENIDRNRMKLNSNNKYNHLKLFQNIYINNDKNVDEPIKVVKIFQ